MSATRLTFCLALLAAAVGLAACQYTGISESPAAAIPAAATSAGSVRVQGAAAVTSAAPSSAAAPSAALSGAAAQAALPAVTLHIAGDSTVSNYASTTKQEGWGMEIGQFFINKVTVDNQAIGGANVKTFQAGNWKKIMAVLKAGDYVMMQFGANDSGTAHGPVTPAEFTAIYEQMADEVKAKGATPIFVTPSAFYEWSNGKEVNNRLAPYAAAMYAAGKAKGVLVDDLNARGVEWLNATGQAETKSFYLPNSAGVPDKAHFVKAGAVQMAKMVAEEVRRINSPLEAYLK